MFANIEPLAFAGPVRGQGGEPLPHWGERGALSPELSVLFPDEAGRDIQGGRGVPRRTGAGMGPVRGIAWGRCAEHHDHGGFFLRAPAGDRSPPEAERVGPPGREHPGHQMR